MRFLWSRVECEAAVGSNVRSVPFDSSMSVSSTDTMWCLQLFLTPLTGENAGTNPIHSH